MAHNSRAAQPVLPGGLCPDPCPAPPFALFSSVLRSRVGSSLLACRACWPHARCPRCVRAPTVGVALASRLYPAAPSGRAAAFFAPPAAFGVWWLRRPWQWQRLQFQQLEWFLFRGRTRMVPRSFIRRMPRRQRHGTQGACGHHHRPMQDASGTEVLHLVRLSFKLREWGSNDSALLIPRAKQLLIATICCFLFVSCASLGFVCRPGAVCLRRAQVAGLP
jgi:hypothetical protein